MCLPLACGRLWNEALDTIGGEMVARPVNRNPLFQITLLCRRVLSERTSNFEGCSSNTVKQVIGLV